MYEFDQNYQINLIKSLCDFNTVTEISKYIASNTTAQLSLCFPSFESQRDTIHFVLEGDDNITIPKLAQILAKIKSAINYDDSLDEEYVTVMDKKTLNKERFIHRYSDITPYNPTNFVKVKEFFADHFSHLSPEIKALSIKEGNVKTAKEESDEVSPDEFYEYLKQNKRMDNYFKRSPDKLNDVAQQASKRYREEEKSNLALPNSTTGISVK